MGRREVTCGDGGVLYIRFDYDRRLVELVKGLPERKWHPAERLWTVPAGHVVAVVELLREEGFSFDETTQRLYAERRREAEDNLTVSQLNLKVKGALQSAFPSPIWLVGEIAGFGKGAHRDVVTFKLVERGEGGKIAAEVDAVLFPDVRQAIEYKLQREGAPFRLEDEVTVRVLVQVDLYVPWGDYRVVIKDLDVAYTLGEVARRREEIIRKLIKAGLLERNRSLPFPVVPLRVGLITSLGSDAERDVLKTLRESGYAFQVTVHGARVQGPYTEPSVLNALDWFRAHAGEFDVVLICRGGGARTDLAWFDSEPLGRAVATFPLPVVVGIGHEEDRSVLDEVGWRAKTPTAAAQLLVEQVRAAEKRLLEGLKEVLGGASSALLRADHRRKELTRRLLSATGGRLNEAKRELGRLTGRLPQAVGTALGGQGKYLEEVQVRLGRAARRELGEAEKNLERALRRLGPRALALLARERERVKAQGKRLHGLDPRRVVERGFAILRLAEGRVVTDPAQAPPGTRLWAELRRGTLRLLSEGGEDGGKGND